MNKKKEIKTYLSTLKLTTIKDILDDELIKAEKDEKSYQELLFELLY